MMPARQVAEYSREEPDSRGEMLMVALRRAPIKRNVARDRT